MIPEKIRILMNNEIDGVNRPAEKDELELYLAENPEARRYFDELRLSLDVLTDLDDVESPENLLFLTLRPDAGVGVWIIRGFGTAVMHGSTAALLAVAAQGVVERKARVRAWHFAPGFLLAAAIHSLFNQFIISPALSAAGLLVGLPALMWLVFRASDRSLQKWLGAGFATDAELLEAINRGQVTRTPVGSYLMSLQERFPPTIVADMFCLLKISVELSLEAKGLLMLRKQGFTVAPSPEITEKLTEVAFLEKSIGPTGRLAVGPLLPRGRKDLWQRQLLG